MGTARIFIPLTMSGRDIIRTVIDEIDNTPIWESNPELHKPFVFRRLDRINPKLVVFMTQVHAHHITKEHIYPRRPPCVLQAPKEQL